MRSHPVSDWVLWEADDKEELGKKFIGGNVCEKLKDEGAGVRVTLKPCEKGARKED